MGEKAAPTQGLSRATLLAVALRSLFLESSWNLIGQQNVGFAAAVNPALRRVYQGRPADLAEARLRVLKFFNTNPMFSGLVIGAALKLEEETAQGLLDENERGLIVAALASSLAIHGDLLFWQSWLPFCSLVGFGLTWLSAAQGQLTLAPLIVPALFCLLAGPARIGGLFCGYRLGRQAHTAAAKYRVPQLARWVLRASVVLVGYLTVRAQGLIPGREPLERVLTVLAVLALVLALVGAQRVWPKLGPMALYLLIVLGLGLVAFFA
ncbi:MAG: PTS system mannose/fructose/sorbose family transporter subunit IID [Deltaproteobacteria bacterium]|jgi:PTS system mannose-specific IID component|nr:PTS system mannose/fructose/sorbose family transporter subunit IID [Deltaproteobacteria bacterium]